MNAKHLIPTLALAGVLTCTGASWASAATTDSQPADSANWSGYVASGTPGSATRRFSSVYGSWIEPSANCTPGEGYSSFWVGLGGSSAQSKALEQVGTEADCSGAGAASHFAWYELVPAAPVRLDLMISPGDHISGRVTVSGTDVTVSLSDQTTGASTTKALQMAEPDISSAEWVAEAPSSCDGSGGCQPLPLADFGDVTFGNTSATANGHTGTISDPNWSAQPVQLDGLASGDGGAGFVGDQSSAGAAPSGLSQDGSSFSVSWISNASQPTTSASAGAYPGDGTGYGSDGGSVYGYDPGYGGGYSYGGGDGAYGIGGLYG